MERELRDIIGMSGFDSIALCESIGKSERRI